MKKNKLFFIALLVLSIVSTKAQRGTNGNVSIDIDINLPLPEVVVVNRKPAPPIRRTPMPNDRVHVCEGYCNHNIGYIENHRHGAGNNKYIYNVTEVSINTGRNLSEHITLNLDGGEILEVIVRRIDARHDDYHFHQDGNHFNKNHIMGVYLNGEALPLKNGNVKLKQKPNGLIELKMDIHSIYNDHFKGKLYI